MKKMNGINRLRNGLLVIGILLPLMMLIPKAPGQTNRLQKNRNPGFHVSPGIIGPMATPIILHQRPKK